MLAALAPLVGPGLACEGYVGPRRVLSRAADPPPPLRTLPTVATPADLTAALAAAQPGDEIVLADGTYPGNYVLGASGAPGRPIVLRAANPLGATLTGLVSLAGAFTWLYRLRFAGQTSLEPYTVEASGDNSSVTRCRFEGCVSTIRILSGKAPGRTGSWVGIGFNAFVGTGKTSENYGNDVRVQLADADLPDWRLRSPVIWRNYLKSVTGAVAPSVYIGQTDNTLYSAQNLDIGALVEWNYFDMMDQDSAVRIKTHGNVVRYNTSLGSGSGSASLRNGGIENRQGHRNLYVANWLDGAGGLHIHGEDNLALGNVGRRNARLNAYAGWAAQGHPPCTGSRFIGNSFEAGCFAIGNSDGVSPVDFPIASLVVEAHKPAASVADGGAVNWFDAGLVGHNRRLVSISSTASIPIPAVVPLTPADVGPSAPA